MPPKEKLFVRRLIHRPELQLQSPCPKCVNPAKPMSEMCAILGHGVSEPAIAVLHAHANARFYTLMFSDWP